MSKSKKVWIPAAIALVAAVILVVCYYVYAPSRGGLHSRFPQGGKGGMPPGGGQQPVRGEGGALEGYFSTFGTIALFVGAASFSWFWFKKKRKSPSMLVRQAGKLFYSLHKLLGWGTFILVAAHGIYFIFTKINDEHILSGLAGFAILLGLAGYGYFINKIRNKWMRTVHRILGVLWVPVLWLHAGGSAFLATAATLAVGGLVYLLDRSANRVNQTVQER
ncbi:hypothetical protein GZH47_00355 [Paenibacillus rhizovicinus]|uniref:Ferric oxidoreductase domain-containing protein n=1 Tax=Paenibacillus rhizovicinus TaxID=2704463 RepID=A0A6C0NTJ2_9BACL|nr:hypothetical protein [Paenibacillus rhizovicinus]QHW29431.1 hypothetical protein GZH47_00355 [Paenibacillus rhizovicinus]